MRPSTSAYRTLNGLIEAARQRGHHAYTRYVLRKALKESYADIGHYTRKWIARIKAGNSYSFTMHFCQAIHDRKVLLVLSVFHYIINHQLHLNLYGRSKSDRILQMIKLSLECRNFDENKPENKYIIDYLVANLGKKF